MICSAVIVPPWLGLQQYPPPAIIAAVGVPAPGTVMGTTGARVAPQPRAPQLNTRGIGVVRGRGRPPGSGRENKSVKYILEVEAAAIVLKTGRAAKQSIKALNKGAMYTIGRKKQEESKKDRGVLRQQGDTNPGCASSAAQASKGPADDEDPPAQGDDAICS